MTFISYYGHSFLIFSLLFNILWIVYFLVFITFSTVLLTIALCVFLSDFSGFSIFYNLLVVNIKSLQVQCKVLTTVCNNYPSLITFAILIYFTSKHVVYPTIHCYYFCFHETTLLRN